MRRFFDFDTGETWTEKELLEEFFRYDGKDENGETIESYLDRALKQGRDRTGGLIELEEGETPEKYFTDRETY